MSLNSFYKDENIKKEKEGENEKREERDNEKNRKKGGEEEMIITKKEEGKMEEEEKDINIDELFNEMKRKADLFDAVQEKEMEIKRQKQELLELKRQQKEEARRAREKEIQDKKRQKKEVKAAKIEKELTEHQIKNNLEREEKAELAMLKKQGKDEFGLNLIEESATPEKLDLYSKFTAIYKNIMEDKFDELSSIFDDLDESKREEIAQSISALKTLFQKADKLRAKNTLENINYFLNFAKKVLGEITAALDETKKEETSLNWVENINKAIELINQYGKLENIPEDVLSGFQNNVSEIQKAGKFKDKIISYVWLGNYKEDGDIELLRVLFQNEPDEMPADRLVHELRNLSAVVGFKPAFRKYFARKFNIFTHEFKEEEEISEEDALSIKSKRDKVRVREEEYSLVENVTDLHNIFNEFAKNSTPEKNLESAEYSDFIILSWLNRKINGPFSRTTDEDKEKLGKEYAMRLIENKAGKLREFLTVFETLKTNKDVALWIQEIKKRVADSEENEEPFDFSQGKEVENFKKAEDLNKDLFEARFLSEPKSIIQISEKIIELESIANELWANLRKMDLSSDPEEDTKYFEKEIIRVSSLFNEIKSLKNQKELLETADAPLSIRKHEDTARLFCMEIIDFEIKRLNDIIEHIEELLPYIKTEKKRRPKMLRLQDLKTEKYMYGKLSNDLRKGNIEINIKNGKIKLNKKEEEK